MPDYNELMVCGNTLLRHRKYKEAATTFDHASRLGVSPVERASALQMGGITLRLNKQLVEARAVFDKAVLLSQGVDDYLCAHIMRDQAMVYLELEQFSTALDLLQKSVHVLELWDDDIEVHVSEGIIGRVYFLQGVRSMRKTGHHYLVRADNELRLSDNRLYELNNLVWLMRASNPLRRFALLPRAIRLGSTTSHHGRILDALAISFAGDRLYRRLRG